MNATSLNNLWTYLQGVLTADDWNWIDEKRSEATTINKVKKNHTVNKKRYKFSPTVKELMGSVHIDPKHIEEDERLKYILSK